ncbi:hypothetical protein Tco_1240633 [Tanacetum coccineum]
MTDYLSIVETDKVNHAMETNMVKFVVEIESFGMSADELDKEIGSSDGLQPKQVDLSCIHALNEPHLHEIHVVSISYCRCLWVNLEAHCWFHGVGNFESLLPVLLYYCWFKIDTAAKD